MALYDISVKLGQQNIVYPGDPAFSREAVTDGGEAMRLTMGAHSGTHLDAPAHFFPEDGQRLDDFPVDHFIMPARVVEILDPVAVQADDLEGLETEPGEAILFRTGNSHSGRVTNGVFTEEYVYLTQGAAMWCVDRKLRLVGLDYISLDAYGDPESPAHHTILGNGLLALEGINLEEVRPGRYRLICLPLSIRGAEGSPVRAVLEEV
ncbi:MAG: cyclase family protein [Armatimonadia bacterium]